MDSQAAIRRLSFAQARGSPAEAMVMMAKHRTELEQAASQGKSEAAKTTEFADRARAARPQTQRIDKTA